MKTVIIVAPVLVMLAMGIFCKKIGIINREGTNVIKKYITTIALAVTCFHAMATATYTKNIVFVVLLMFGILGVSFLVGFPLAKLLSKEPYRKYFPFLMTVYEGGMLGYPLYQNLYGADMLSNIALVDMAGGIFSFGIYFSVLNMMENNTKLEPKSIVLSAVKSPCFIGLIAGLICGATGIMQKFLALPVGEVYTSVKDIMVAPIAAMILLCIGFDFELDKKLTGVCLKTVFTRFLLQCGMAALAVFLFTKLNLGKEMIVAGILYLMLPPSFCLTSFVKSEEGGAYIATTQSLYIIITIVVYILLAAFMV